MFKKLRFIITVALALLVCDAQARPLLLELYTSQGCSSCPAGEKVVSDLNTRSDFFALSFHVDYWDRLGWKDVFSKPEFTARQQRYVKYMDLNSLYTPQVVIDGAEDTIASWDWRVKMKASSLRDDMEDVPLDIEYKGGHAFVKLPATDLLGRADVWYVTYNPSKKTDVTTGENAGLRMQSTNVVYEYAKLLDWDGRAITLKLPNKESENLKYAVVAQVSPYGRVLGFVHE